MLITRISIADGKERTRDIPCTEEQYKNWENGMHIQRAMPNVSESDREFILTGLTNEQWDELFPEEEEYDRFFKNLITKYHFKPNKDENS